MEQQAENLILVGANHRSSTMQLRDRLFVNEASLPAFYERLREAGLRQAVILSTTDVTEVIAVSDGDNGGQAGAEEIVRLLTAHAGVSRSEIENQTYILSANEAIKHVFAVAGALDSLIIGDQQILGRLRAGHRIARSTGMSGAGLDRLLTAAEAASERIGRETEIGRRPVSIAAAAVQVARDLHGDLSRCTGLLIGAGEMGEMLASGMVSAGLGNLIVAHPSATRADQLSQHLNCHAGAMEDMDQLLTQADIIVTSMNKRSYILDAGVVNAATKARRRKPIFLIDTGVPGDVDPAVEKIEDAFFYTLDDLERVTREGRASREAEAEKAWAIVSTEAEKFSFPSSTDRASDSKSISDDQVEELRKEALKDAGNDADKATKLLLERLMKLREKDR